jgi:hypothetical protein
MNLRIRASFFVAFALLTLTGTASAGNPPVFHPAKPQQASTNGSSSDGKDHWFIPKGSSCVNDTNATPGKYARVSFLMHADGFPTSAVENFILHARMIPHGQNLAGQNWTRSWTTFKDISLIGGSAGHSRVLFVLTPVPDVEKDWDLQVKLQWKRMSRLDWNKTLTIQFNEARCPA